MIIGVGIDIIDVRRIQKTLDRFGSKFKDRCFSISEIKYSERKNNSTNSYAKRYSAKEACAKALGTGLARGIFWKDIEVKNNQYGKPDIILHGKAIERLKKISKGKFDISISLSDEQNYAVASVIISKKNDIY